MSRWLNSPWLWLVGWACWACLLWVLSSWPQPLAPPPPWSIQDKIKHFSYFLVGAILLTGYFYLLNPRHASWRLITFSVLGLLGITGALDEYHQSFVPGRSGNDPFDWLANMAGASLGCAVFYAMHLRVKWNS